MALIRANQESKNDLQKAKRDVAKLAKKVFSKELGKVRL